jgi:hypothetical protein
MITVNSLSGMNTHLSVLSFGGGQDGTYILYKIIRNPEYRNEFAPGHLIVVMIDTGSEHKHTYEHVEFIKKLCADNDIEFYFVTSDWGFHPNTWLSLESQMIKNNSIMSMMFPRSCTDNLKIKPFYNFLNVYIGNIFYDQDLPSSTRDKRWINRFNDDFGKINVILGIAAGEEIRITKASKKELKANQTDLFKKIKRAVNVWMTKCIIKTYPMVIEGIDRQGAQDYINVTPWPLPYPSNCDICPYLTKQEILWLYRFSPERWSKWVIYEINKMNRNPGVPTNLGVKGLKLLPEILAEAIAEFGHWTDDQLDEYKMSHGHCVKSKY